MSEPPAGRPPVPPGYQGYPPSYGGEPGYPAGPPPGQQWPPPVPTAGPGRPPPPTPYLPRPAQQTHPHPEPRSYALMLRTWDYQWWKPVLGVLALAAGGLLVVPLLLMPVLAVGVVIEGGPFAQRFADAATLKHVTPSAMLYLNLTLASLVLVAMAIERWVHRLRPRWLMSVRPGIRWKFFFACLGLSVVALVAQSLVGLALPANTDQGTGHPGHVTGQLVALAVVILLTTPLQAMGEEYAFRGYLTQAFGSLFGSRVVAVVVPALLFALAHGAQNAPLFFDRFAFGLMAGFLVLVVGGLEAGIALHVLNNLLAFGLAIAFGDVTQSLTVSHVSWWQIPLTVTQNGVYLVLVMLVARRMGVQRRTSPPVLEPPAGQGETAPEPAVAPIGE
jgi:uncharacterized protein